MDWLIPAGHDWLDVVEVITALILAIGALGGIIGYSLRKAKVGSETKNLDAQTIQLYQTIADNAAERALKLEQRISVLEKTIDSKDKRIDELETANTEKDKQIKDLRCQIDLLQLKVDHLEGRKSGRATGTS